LKKLITTVAMLLFMGITFISYSYWDSLQKKENVNISIGKATTLLVSITENVPEGKTLIPADVLQGINDITSVSIKYSVKLDKIPIVSPALNVEANDIKIGGETTYSDLVVISISKPDIVSGDFADVTVLISLKKQSEGITEEAYNAINSQLITFELIFTAIII
jgi:hypothetical protein